MFDQLKKFFTKSFTPTKKTKEKKEPFKKTSPISTFEPSSIELEPPSESVIKKTKRTLKYRY